MMKRCPSSAPAVHCSNPYHCTITVDPPSACGAGIGAMIVAPAFGSGGGGAGAGAGAGASEACNGGIFDVGTAAELRACGRSGVPALMRWTSAIPAGISTTSSNRTMPHSRTFSIIPDPSPKSFIERGVLFLNEGAIFVNRIRERS